MTAELRQKSGPLVLTLPGWKGSEPAHWQSRWETLYGYQRVEQHDWRHPLRGDWSARLDEVMADAQAPVVLVAHNLGCVLTAWWAGHSRFAHKVQSALLVAPIDVENEPLRTQLHSWRPVFRQTLPFRCAVLASRNDPHCSLGHAQTLAQDWGAAFQVVDPLDRINADAHLGMGVGVGSNAGADDWPAGHSSLLRLMQPEPGHS